MSARPDNQPALSRLLAGFCLFALLMVWLFQFPRDEAPRTRRIARVAAELDRMKAELARLQANAQRRASPTPSAFHESLEVDRRRAEAIRLRWQEDAMTFAATEDHVTSSTMELAMDRMPGQLVGWVSDDRGQPIDGARIGLRWEEPVPANVEPASLETRSSERGLFQFDEVSPGFWTLTGEKDDHARASITGLRIQSGERHPPAELRLAPEIVLTGRVMVGELPVEGAAISAYRQALAVHHEGAVVPVRLPHGTTTTAADGGFVLEQLPAGALTLVVRAPGFALHRQQVELVAAPPPLLIHLGHEAMLMGVVRNELGDAVEGASLGVALPDATEVEATTTSNDRGVFRFTGLRARQRYQLTARAQGYADAGPVIAESGSTQNVLIMSTGSAIEGTVTNFETGRPMARIGVLASRAAGEGRRELTTTTNSSGQYRIGRLPAGTYTVAILSDRFTTSPRLGVRVTPGAEVKDIDFSIYPGMEIIGRVLDGDTQERLPNAHVVLESRVGPDLLLAKRATEITDNAGAFAFPNMPAGIYRLRATLDGYMPGLGEEAEVRLELLRGTTMEPAELKLYRGGVIEGTVTTIQGMPVPDALIQLFHAAGSPSTIAVQNFKTKTNAGGSYTIEGLPVQHEVHLFASATPEYGPKGRSERLVLGRRQTQANGSIVLPLPGSLEVTVLNNTGMGLNEARVEIVGHDDFFGDPVPEAWAAQTDPGGDALLRHLPPGFVLVMASKVGHLLEHGRAEIVAGETARLSLNLMVASSLAGRVVDDLGQPVTEGQVSAHPEDDARGGGAGAIAHDGTFLIETLGPGTYRLAVEARRATSTGQRQVQRHFPGQLPNNAMSEAALVVPMTGMLGGAVMGEDGKPPPQYTVRLAGEYHDGQQPQRIEVTHTFPGNERWLFDNLPPGVYTAHATAPDMLPGESAPATVTSPGPEASAGTIKLSPGGRLRLVAVDDRTREPIDNALATVPPDGPAGRTNNRGEVTLAPLTPGLHTLTLSHADYLPTTVDLVRIGRGDEHDLEQVRMVRGGVLFGRVEDTRGQPLTSIQIEARATTGELRTATTDAAGGYSMRGMTLGGHIVTYSGTVNERHVSQSLDVTLSNFDDTRRDVVLVADARLTGYLAAHPTVDVSRSVVMLYPLRADGTPALRDAISARLIEGNRFRAGNLAYGQYLATVQAPNMATGMPAQWHNVLRVYEPESSGWVNQGSATFSGIVRQSPGGPVMPMQELRMDLLSAPHSQVPSLRRWWQWTARADHTGRFTFDQLPPGTYSFVAHNEILEADILEIVIISGPHHTAEFTF